jgi:hypothetical protein
MDPTIFERAVWEDRIQQLIALGAVYIVHSHQAGIAEASLQAVRNSGTYLANHDIRQRGLELSQLQAAEDDSFLAYVRQYKLVVHNTINPFFFNTGCSLEGATGILFLWLEKFRQTYSAADLTVVEAAFSQGCKLEKKLIKAAILEYQAAPVLIEVSLVYQDFYSWYDKLEDLYYGLQEVCEWLDPENEDEDLPSPQTIYQQVVHCSTLVLEFCQEYKQLKRRLRQFVPRQPAVPGPITELEYILPNWPQVITQQ